MRLEGARTDAAGTGSGAIPRLERAAEKRASLPPPREARDDAAQAMAPHALFSGLVAVRQRHRRAYRSMAGCRRAGRQMELAALWFGGRHGTAHVPARWPARAEGLRTSGGSEATAAACTGDALGQPCATVGSAFVARAGQPWRWPSRGRPNARQLFRARCNLCAKRTADFMQCALAGPCGVA